MNEPTHVDLFSGIGGFALAAQWAGFRTIAFCEIDKYCQKVLAKNFPYTVSDGCGSANRDTGTMGGEESQEEGSESESRCIAPSVNSSNPRFHTNIFDFDGTKYRGCDLLTGGFPCQPFSVAGKRRGAADDRAIWPEMFRVISEARPAWLLAENVPGIIPMELDNVLSDLEGIGYSCRPFVIPACAVDARHRRDRLWIVGRFVGNSAGTGSFPASHARVCGGEEGAGPRNEESERRGHNMADANEPGSQGCNVSGNSSETGGRETLAYASILRQQGQGESFNAECSTEARDRETVEPWDGSRSAIWLPEPDVGRVAHGIPSRVDRLKGLGNAIVPQVAFEILKVIYDEILS